VIGRKIGTMDEVSGKESLGNRYVDMGAKGVVTNECLRLNSASDSGSRGVLPDDVESCGERGIKSNKVDQGRNKVTDS
jgi:hypothetical protein